LYERGLARTEIAAQGDHLAGAGCAPDRGANALGGRL
jgi:hypothetical protein